MDDDITSIYELLDAIEAVIKAADPAKREALTRTIDAYAESFPEDFFWATGSQARPPKCHPRHRDACALSTLPRRPARD